MGFRELSLQEEYRSDKDSIVDDFLVKCLEVSEYYDRAVGYFTSAGLSLAVRGIVEFIKGGGKRIRLVASPVLAPEDANAITAGYEKRNEVVTSRVLDVLESEMSELETKRIGILGWLVSHGYLDIKLAIREPVDDQWQGIYHEKIGIFYNHGGDKIAFIGSANETKGGLLSNFECIDTYTSWDLPLRVERKIAAFNDLWENRTFGLTVFPFPEAARRKLIQLAVADLPECDPESKRTAVSRPHRGLRYYQTEAINFWREHNYKALLTLATGTGKTFTALKAVEPLVWEGYTVVVLVPRTLLLDQWVKEIESLYESANILECSGSSGWRSDLSSFLILGSRRANDGFAEPLFIVSTIHSASDSDFISTVRAYAERLKLILVVDETHWLGAPEFAKAMEIPAEKRLGLSATPERGWDEEGTERVFQFYDGNEYEYGLQKAVEDGYLVPYDYIVREVELTESEYKDYIDLTKKIAQMIARSGKDEPEDVKGLDRLLFKRASIVKASDSKRGFVRWVHDNFRPQMCLVYCENIDHLRLVKKDLSDMGEFTVEYHSGLSDEQKQAALAALRRGDARYMVSIRCLDEGIDIPECRAAIILSSSQTKRVFIQRRGRVLRIALGKTHAQIFDPVVVPSVPGKGHSVELDGLTLRELERVEEFAWSARPLSKIQVANTVSKIREKFVL